ncbi:LssY C-terminus [Arthrobacter sp. ov407]|uniref:LssY C-terminal domain-containing protein n=1 Tax=Arthrobacter sp. ov407 TaxID=1761748 RepID=UPI00088843F6|nr:LssY C-terminal domain-containing protein [Arthrobacter sp. ov407]SDL95468.1 LssY C-terminus [Arthrobacter sp. ov407]
MTAMAKAAVEVTAPAEAVPYSALDTVFFVVGGISAVWLTSLLVQLSFQWGWAQVWFLFIFWGLLAYLVLPRLHRILTRLYVPDYFIGRARTSDGLLGDPVNVALLGTEPQIHGVMQSAGWTLADDVTLASSRRIVSSTLRRRSYLQAPVSPLFLFGRQQDFAYQLEVDGTPGKRHHVRFWRCPPGWLLPGGLAVDWLAAGTYDHSVGLSLFTLQITHKIDENTDAERDHVVGAITEADPAAGLRVIRDFSTGYHARNGGGDTIITDGDLPIVDLRNIAAAPDVKVWPPSDGPPSDSRNRRPAATIVGAVFVGARAAAAALLAMSMVLFKDAHVGSLMQPVAGPAVTEAQAELAVTAATVVVLLFALAEILLAWFVFLGRHWARTVAMALSTVAIGLQAFDVFLGGPDITLQSNLPGLALDILLLLALSSKRSRDYALRPRKEPKRDSSRPGGRAPF